MATSIPVPFLPPPRLDRRACFMRRIGVHPVPSSRPGRAHGDIEPKGVWMRRFIALFATSALFALVGGVVLAAPALAAEMQISQDPYTNPDSQHQTQVEPDVFSFGSTIVAVFQSGRYF